MKFLKYSQVVSIYLAPKIPSPSSHILASRLYINTDESGIHFTPYLSDSNFNNIFLFTMYLHIRSHLYMPVTDPVCHTSLV